MTPWAWSCRGTIPIRPCGCCSALSGAWYCFGAGERNRPAWFDLAGSGILVISVLFGGWIVAETARRRTGGLAARRPFHPAAWVKKASYRGIELRLSRPVGFHSPFFLRFAPLRGTGKLVRDNLSLAGWSWGYVSAIPSKGRKISIADVHGDNAKDFVVRAGERLTAFLKLESAICAFSPAFRCSRWTLATDWSVSFRLTRTRNSRRRSDEIDCRPFRRWSRIVPATRPTT